MDTFNMTPIRRAGLKFAALTVVTTGLTAAYVATRIPRALSSTTHLTKARLPYNPPRPLKPEEDGR